MSKCPFCDKEIDKNSKVCPICNEDINFFHNSNESVEEMVKLGKVVYIKDIDFLFQDSTKWLIIRLFVLLISILIYLNINFIYNNLSFFAFSILLIGFLLFIYSIFNIFLFLVVLIGALINNKKNYYFLLKNGKKIKLSELIVKISLFKNK